jgi:phosphoglycolate phosphatase/pyrophosphatase PpaX
MRKKGSLNETYKAFVFDFDGTLGDTKECVVVAFQKALSQNELPVAKREQIIHFMGLSLKDAFRKLTNEAVKETMYEKLVSDYRACYREFLVQKTFLFPEVVETLEKLKRGHVLLSIATSKKTEFARLSCQHLHIDKYFDLYVGDDMVTHKKPHPEMLLYTLHQLKIDKSDAVMIGDSTFDIEMGNAIGMDTIAVSWGAHPITLLQSTKPRYMIHQFSELTQFLDPSTKIK